MARQNAASRRKSSPKDELGDALALPIDRPGQDPTRSGIFDVEQLPRLDAKQMEFVAAVASGMSALDAYRRAYPECSKHPAQDVWRFAMLLRSNEGVARWIHQAQINDLARPLVTREAHIAELDEAKRFSYATQQAGAAVRAIELKGRASGFYVERSVVEHVSQNPEEILDRIAVVSPELAQSMADKAGLAWKAPIEVSRPPVRVPATVVDRSE